MFFLFFRQVLQLFLRNVDEILSEFRDKFQKMMMLVDISTKLQEKMRIC